MDIAEMIADASVKTFKNECSSNTCNVEINMHCRYKYIISIIPMATHILIRYKSLEYKIARADKDAYESTIDFLVDAISDDAGNSLSDEIEFGNYWPDHDEDFSTNTIRVVRHETQVFWNQFKEENMDKAVKRYLMTLRFLN